MLKRVRDSRPYLEQWIEKNGVENSDVARILEGFDLSLQDDREPVDEMQLPDFYVPGLTASAWWDKGQFPWVASIEKSFPQILGEFQSIGGVTADSAVEHPARLDDQGRWSAYYLYFVGRLYSDHARACPNTMKALGEVPGWNESGMVYFSILDPQTHVAAHSGFTNTHLRCVHAEHGGERDPAHRVTTGRRREGRVGNGGANDACSASFIMAIQLRGASSPSMRS
jgi:hypothetical protein